MSKTIHTVSSILDLITKESIKYIDVKFTDYFGTWHHLTIPSHNATSDFFKLGVPFDGSSITGWQAINEADMILLPMPETAMIDPFFEVSVLSLTCNVFDPKTKKLYEKCPRSIAQKAVDYLKKSGIGDTMYFGPEPEFFIFDSIKYTNTTNKSSYEIDSSEAHWNSNTENSLGHKIKPKGGYFPVAPIDQTSDLRLEMMEVLTQVGLDVERGHHEVATAGQGEINFKYEDLVTTADNIQTFKYVVKNVAFINDKVATFLPKPLAGDNGSGMHLHFSIWKDGQNLFAGSQYAGLSELAIYAIGGIIKHGKALAAITNPTTNSYHRLVPGFEAPVNLAYSYRNRSASIRIPYSDENQPKAKRIELRFPDPSANPYLATAAIAMAVMDGIKNKIHPGDAVDVNIWETLDGVVPKMPSSLTEALDSLKNDMDFLLEGGVFTKELLETYISLKTEEIDAIRLVPHPKEFELYAYI